MKRLQADKPDWGPLERLIKAHRVPSHVLGQWMFMFSDGSIRAYKNYWTREYIYLDCSRAYKYVERGYRRIPKTEALVRVRNGNDAREIIESMYGGGVGGSDETR